MIDRVVGALDAHQPSHLDHFRRIGVDNHLVALVGRHVNGANTPGFEADGQANQVSAERLGVIDQPFKLLYIASLIPVSSTPTFRLKVPAGPTGTRSHHSTTSIR